MRGCFIVYDVFIILGMFGTFNIEFVFGTFNIEFVEWISQYNDAL